MYRDLLKYLAENQYKREKERRRHFHKLIFTKFSKVEKLNLKKKSHRGILANLIDWEIGLAAYPNQAVKLFDILAKAVPGKGTKKSVVLKFKYKRERCWRFRFFIV